MNQNTIINFIRRFSHRSTFVMYIKDLYVNRKRPLFLNNKHLFQNKDGVEFGGPSPIFKAGKSIPTYKVASSIDNVNYSESTFWSKHSEGAEFNPYGQGIIGEEWIMDATNVPADFHKTYDFLQSNHVLEHIANPAKALLGWRTLLKDSGVILIMVPDKRRTYDLDRPYSTLSHLVDQYKNDVGEDDKSKFQEVIELHRIEYDDVMLDKEDLKEKVMNNPNSRLIHQQLYTPEILSELLELCGFDMIGTEVFLPYHIAALAKKSSHKPKILDL